jgi:hypothetical protein
MPLTITRCAIVWYGRRNRAALTESRGAAQPRAPPALSFTPFHHIFQFNGIQLGHYKKLHSTGKKKYTKKEMEKY